MKKMLMGNEAIALGAIAAGVNLVTGYPGTPSTEILESVAKQKDSIIYTEWSVNEKSALEVAAGAAYAGAYTMVTMKQVGLNVASDPLMSLAYVGIGGAMVVVVADDPGPISSQTEQDTRHFAEFAKLPVFDPSTTQEAYDMIRDAFAYSHQYQTPVLFRPTTRICHAYASIEVSEKRTVHAVDGFVKNSKWVIFPRLAYLNHVQMEKRNVELSDVFSRYAGNFIKGSGNRGIAAGGVSYAYVCDALGNAYCKILKVSTPHPFPEQKALEFLDGLDEVLVVEELDPVIEKALLLVCAKYHLNVKIKGKLTGHIQNAGENTVNSVEAAVAEFLGLELKAGVTPELPPLPVRPPVLCAGCPHRASFYAVKTAMKKLKNKKAVFSGDIGCYTLGNAMPLDMVDTCLCMGAGITIAQGLHRAEPDTVNFAFIGDSTFFHTGIPGVINALYNQTDIILVVLDNKTTAMTGNQPHPGTGNTMMGTIANKISIYKMLSAMGVEHIAVLDPLELGKAQQAVTEMVQKTGVRAIIFESPCINVAKGNPPLAIDQDKCKKCMRCTKEIGCPAIFSGEKITIDKALCNGCGLCVQVCPFGAIGNGGSGNV